MDKVQFYEVRGQGVPLLMIASGGGDGWHYSFVVDILADEYKVITYDRRANARSTMNNPQNFEISQQSRDAVAVLHAVGEQSAFVFGNSRCKPIIRKSSLFRRSAGICALASRRGNPVDSLTVVGRKRLELAKTLAMEPTLLLLDEVMAGLRSTEIDQAAELIHATNQRGITVLVDELSLGLAPIVIDRLIETIAQVNQTGVTVLLVEQDVQVAFDIASWAMSWKPDMSPFPAMPRVCSTMNGSSRLIWDCDSGFG